MRSEHVDQIRELAREELKIRILNLAKEFNLSKLSEYKFWSPEANIKNHSWIWFHDKTIYNGTNSFNTDNFRERIEDIVADLCHEYNDEDFIATCRTNNPNVENKIVEIHFDW